MEHVRTYCKSRKYCMRFISDSEANASELLENHINPCWYYVTNLDKISPFFNEKKTSFTS